LAQRAEAARRLHAVADRLRYCYGLDAAASGELRALETLCRQEWDHWAADVQRGEAELEMEVERQREIDLLDLGVLWADLHVRLAAGPEAKQARREALQRLAEVESLLGPSIVLYRERQTHAEGLGLHDLARTAAQQVAERTPRTAWEHYALGRSHLRSGDLDSA